MKKTPEMFDSWNEQKKQIEFRDPNEKNGDVGEFWRYWEGVNIGHEISKDGYFKRVCLILKNNLGNGLYLVAPITTKFHDRYKHRLIPVHRGDTFKLKTCRIIINQIKLIDPKRLVYKTNKHTQQRSLVGFILEQWKHFL